MLGLTPNRVAAISSVAADAGAAVVALTGTLPTNLQTTAVLVAACLAKTGVVLKFLQGSQNWDAIQARAAVLVNNIPAPQVAEPVAVNQVPVTLAPPEQPVYGAAPNDTWPQVDPTYNPQVAGAPDPHE